MEDELSPSKKAPCSTGAVSAEDGHLPEGFRRKILTRPPSVSVPHGRRDMCKDKSLKRVMYLYIS